MLLVFRYDSLQDGVAFLRTRLINGDGLKAAFESRILFNVLSILFDGRSTNHLQFSTRECRLQNVCGIQCSLCATGTNDGMKLINKQQHLSTFNRFSKNTLDALFKLTTILRSGHHAGNIQCHYALMQNGFRHIL